MKPFEIFKPGTHTASNGAALTFAAADLEAMADNYDPALHHAPIVAGHPKDDAPAYGWVGALSVTDGRLVASPSDVDPAFADLVKSKRFGKVSAALYLPDSANNPKPGAYYLRHVGFLGAAAPAVKGLKPVEFAAGDAGVEIEIAFADSQTVMSRASWAFEAMGRLLRGLREKMIASESIEAANQALPEWEIESLSRMAADLRSEADEAAALSYRDTQEKDETMKTAQEQEAARLAALDADLRTREAAAAEREAAFAERARQALATEDAAFVDGLVEKGTLPVGLKATALACFSGLSADDLTFSDGDEQKTMAPRAALQSLLGSLPLPVETGERAKGEVADFSDPQQVKGAIESEMKKADAEGKPISPAEAASRIKGAQS